METGLTIYQKIDNPLAAAEKLGQWMARSGMFGLTSAEQGMVLALTCLSEGITPVAFKRRYHLIDGNLSMRSDAMLAEFRMAGGKHQIISRTPDLAAISLTMDGLTAEFRFSWTEAQAEPYVRAKDGKTLKRNWSTPRGRTQMLWARVVSDAVRAVAPEIVAGVDCPEEVADFDRPITPAKSLFVSSVPASPPPEPEQQNENINPKPDDGINPEPDVTAALVAAGCDLDDVTTFLVEKAHWLTPGQGLDDLSPQNKIAILNRLDKFVVAVQTFAQEAVNG